MILSEKKAAAKLRSEIESVTEILQKEKDMALQHLAEVRNDFSICYILLIRFASNNIYM